jgi:serine/threonine protein kinase
MTRLKERLDEERKGIPGYTDFRELGKGAMAKVYRAKQRSLDRYVAVKILPRSSAATPSSSSGSSARGRRRRS